MHQQRAGRGGPEAAGYRGSEGTAPARWSGFLEEVWAESVAYALAAPDHRGERLVEWLGRPWAAAGQLSNRSELHVLPRLDSPWTAHLNSSETGRIARDHCEACWFLIWVNKYLVNHLKLLPGVIWIECCIVRGR